jgi:hypothetical protein
LQPTHYQHCSWVVLTVAMLYFISFCFF